MWSKLLSPAAARSLLSQSASRNAYQRLGNEKFEKFHSNLNLTAKSYATTTQSTQSHATKEPDQPVKVYYGTLTPRMKAVKVFSITTSLTGMAAQPIIMEQGSKLGGAPMMYFMCGVVGFFTFVTPVLLHVITKKYVTEISYDPRKEEYTATTISFFLTKIETKFKLKDIQVPEVPGMFSTFLVNGKTPLFVDASQFTDPEHYVKMMGYDKPLDLKMNLEEEQTNVPKEPKQKS